jgi:type I restriction enzyme S subunit
MAKLGEICTVVSGSTPKTSVASYWDGSIKWITPAELNNESFYITDSVRHITEEGKEKTGLSCFPAGTVILSSRAPIGKTAIAGCEMCCNQGFKNLICSEKIYNEYLYFFLKSKTNYLNSLGRGATFKEISKTIVENVEVPLPDINQQKGIAEKFKKLEELISLRKQQLVKLDELVKARFVEMFGDAKLNPYDFPCNSLSEYILFLTSGSRGWSRYFTDSGEYFITIKNVKNCRITLQDVQYVTPPDNAEAKRTKVQENDLLISITADLGRTGVVTKRIAEHGAYINQHLTCIRLNLKKANPIYVAYYMESDAGKEQFASKNQSAVKAGLNFNAINSLKLVVPPLDLQNDFAAFVECVDQQKQTIQQSLDKLELMKKALMQEYFG